MLEPLNQQNMLLHKQMLFTLQESFPHSPVSHRDSYSTHKHTSFPRKLTPEGRTRRPTQHPYPSIVCTLTPLPALLPAAHCYS